MGVTTFVTGLTITPLAKFVMVKLADSHMLLYETMTDVVWRHDKIMGSHSGVALGYACMLNEYIKEGRETEVLWKIRAQMGIHPDLLFDSQVYDNEEVIKRFNTSSVSSLTDHFEPMVHNYHNFDDPNHNPYGK